MSIDGQGHFFTIYFPGFVCFVLYKAKISGERLQDHLSSGFSFPGQSYSGTSFQVKSAWKSRSIPSRPKSRRSSTLDSIRPKHFFYHFVFLLLYFLLSFQFPTSLTHLSLCFYYHFPSRTPLVIILITEGIPVYWQKAKQKTKQKKNTLNRFRKSLRVYRSESE